MLHDRIRELRKKNKVTLKQVAQDTELSASYLSQIETGKVEPSIAVLRKLAAYFGVLIVYFFTTETNENIVVREDRRKTFGRPGSPLTYELLQNDINNKKMQLVIMKLAPHYSDPEDFYLTFNGEECIYVVSGILGFEYDKKTYYLKKGDSIYYNGWTPYRLFNPTDEMTEIIGASSPPEMPQVVRISDDRPGEFDAVEFEPEAGA
jgi:Predicted transcriptional regulators